MIELSILSSKGSVYEGVTDHVVVPGLRGVLDIKAGYDFYVFSLIPGVVSFSFSGGGKCPAHSKFFSFGDGVATIKSDKMTVLLHDDYYNFPLNTVDVLLKRAELEYDNVITSWKQLLSAVNAKTVCKFLQSLSASGKLEFHITRYVSSVVESLFVEEVDSVRSVSVDYWQHMVKCLCFQLEVARARLQVLRDFD